MNPDRDPGNDPGQRPADTTGSPIEDCLDQLFEQLAAHPQRDARHLLAEVEAHLRDAAAEGVARGTDPHEAEQVAVDRLGRIDEIVAAEQSRRTTPLRDLVRAGLLTGLFLGSLGAVAVGVSGGIASAFRAAGGSQFVVALPRAATLRPSDCARWLAASPHTTSCAQAAQADWTAETIWYRAALGIVGLLGLAVWFVARHRLRREGRWAMLPRNVVDTVAATAFGAAGVWLLGQSIDAVVVSSGHGAGQWLSAAPVALALGALFAVRLIRDLHGEDVSPHAA